MKVTRREFQIRQLTEFQNEFIVEEYLYVFGFCLWHVYHSKDGVNGEYPFTDYIQAKRLRDELERKEESSLIGIWTLLVIIVIIFYICS